MKGLRKILTGIALIVPLMIFALMPALCSATSFTDVSVTHPMHDSITYLAERGFVSGYEDGTFKPDRVVTRAEILKFALKAADIEIITSGEVSFTDVPKDVWYYSYVATAASKGIVSGYDDGTFQPERVVTRAEGSKIILKALQVQLPESYSGGLTDVSSEDWFAPYVEYIRKYDLMTLEGEEFKPDQGLKRQDVAEVVYHFIKAEEMLKSPIWPIQPWLKVVVIYLIFCLLVWHLVKGDKYQWILIAFAPISIFYIISGMLTFKISIEKDESMQVVAHRKQFAYFRNPRRLEREFLSWIDVNAKPLFALGVVILLWSIIIFIITTQVNTISYKTPFTNLAETYVDISE